MRSISSNKYVCFCSCLTICVCYFHQTLCVTLSKWVGRQKHVYPHDCNSGCGPWGVYDTLACFLPLVLIRWLWIWIIHIYGALKLVVVDMVEAILLSRSLGLSCSFPARLHSKWLRLGLHRKGRYQPLLGGCHPHIIHIFTTIFICFFEPSILYVSKTQEQSNKWANTLWEK